MQRLILHTRFCIVTVLGCYSASVHAVEWHISPAGNDSTNGSMHAPFQTIARGLKAAKPGDTILLHDGIYRETIAPLQSGVTEAPITLKNAPEARPLVSARDPVIGPWTAEGHGIYRTEVPVASGLTGSIPKGGNAASSGVDQIFIDGNPQPEARFPNKKSADPMKHDGIEVDLRADFTLLSKAIAGYPDDIFSGARIYARIYPKWTAQNGVVVSSSGEKLVIAPTGISTPWWPNPDLEADADDNHSNVSATGEMFLFGSRKLIDSDGEWHLERGDAGDTLYLQPPAGRDPSNHSIERKIRPWTLDLSGVNHWIVKGIRLEGGAVRLKGNSLVVEECELSHSSHFQVFSDGYGYNGGRDYGSAIMIEGNANIVRKCLIRDSAGSGIGIQGRGHLVTHNQILNVDYSGTYGAGIALDGTGNRVEFNTIRNTGRDGIVIRGGGHEILYNDISRSGRITLDGGMVYTYCQNGVDAAGKRTRIAYNWVHESGNPADLKCRGIYMDNYSRGFVIDHNVIWGMGRPGKNKGIHIGAPAEGIACYHNTLIDCLPPTGSTFNKFPSGNGNPGFWTAATNHLEYDYQNNLHLPGNSSSTVLANPAARDFRPRRGSRAVDPDPIRNVIRWKTTDGTSGVPDGYKYASQKPDVAFTFKETHGQGVLLPGLNDHYTGSTPDDGANEHGSPLWRPGHDGFAVE